MDIHYESGYRNRFWLNVDVMKPTYTIDRDAYENSLGESINTFIKWSKQYTFDIYCLEPLADALTSITLHDQVWITLPNGYSAQCKDFLANVTWTEINNLAKVTVTFITNTYSVNGNSAAGCTNQGT